MLETWVLWKTIMNYACFMVVSHPNCRHIFHRLQHRWLHLITHKDEPQQCNFATVMLCHINMNPGFLPNILISHETSLHLTGTANQHNRHICGSGNPHSYYAGPRLKVRCGLKENYWPFFTQAAISVMCILTYWNSLGTPSCRSEDDYVLTWCPHPKTVVSNLKNPWMTRSWIIWLDATKQSLGYHVHRMSLHWISLYGDMSRINCSIPKGLTFQQYEPATLMWPHVE
jgi:hypothetical protein